MRFTKIKFRDNDYKYNKYFCFIAYLCHFYALLSPSSARTPHPSAPQTPSPQGEGFLAPDRHSEPKGGIPCYVVLGAWERGFVLSALCEGILTAATPCALLRQNTSASGYLSLHRALHFVPLGMTLSHNPPASQARHRLTQVDLALGQQFCLHMQNCQLMRARTPHRGAAHDARIRPLHRKGIRSAQERSTMFSISITQPSAMTMRRNTPSTRLIFPVTVW